MFQVWFQMKQCHLVDMHCKCSAAAVLVVGAVQTLVTYESL